jgi:hypothetical protein
MSYKTDINDEEWNLIKKSLLLSENEAIAINIATEVSPF